MKRTVVIIGALLLASSSAWAQTTGSITLKGTVNSTLDMKYVSSVLQNGALQTSAQVLNNPLAFVMDLRDVGDLSRGPAMIGGVVRIALRGNNAAGTQFQLQAKVTSATNMDVVGGPGVGLDDIGFGVSALDTSGANLGSGGMGATIVGVNNYDPSTTPIGGNSTLNTIAAAPVRIVQGAVGPISSGGAGLTDPSNAVYVDLSFGIAPQMYTPVASFSAVVDFTLSTI
jgi:hypothetical protein